MYKVNTQVILKSSERKVRHAILMVNVECEITELPESDISTKYEMAVKVIYLCLHNMIELIVFMILESSLIIWIE